MAAGLIGIGIAYFMYIVKPSLADSISSSLGGLYRLVYNKYFVDEIYDAAVVKPLVSGSRVVLWRGVDAGLIDGAVNGVGSIRKASAAGSSCSNREIFAATQPGCCLARSFCCSRWA